MSVRSDIEPGFQSPTRLQGDIQSSIRWSIWVLLPHTMSKSLVQIENEKLLYTFLGELEINLSSKYFIFWNWVHILQVVDRLQNMNCKLSNHESV